jgi:hypothetical protein
MASHASRPGLPELPRPGRSALPLLALAFLALVLEADPSLRLAGVAAAACFGLAAGVRALRARIELRRIRRAADRLILTGVHDYEGSEIVRWRTRELVRPELRQKLAADLERTIHRLAGDRLPSASPLRRVALRRHEELLRELDSRLLDGRPVSARGVLRLQRLLREPSSPLYDEAAERELGRAIAVVRAQLEP